MEEFFSMQNDYAELLRECKAFLGKRVLGVQWLFKYTLTIECCDPSDPICLPERRGEERRNWYIWLWKPDWTICNRGGDVVATRPTPDERSGERSIEFGSHLIGSDIEQFEIDKLNSSIVVSLSNGNSLRTGPCIDGADATDDEVCWMALFPNHVALEVGYNGQRWKRVLTQPRKRNKA